MNLIYWPDYPTLPTLLPFDALNEGIPSRYRVRIGTGKKLEWLGYNLVKVA